MPLLLVAVALVQPALKVGVIADELVDYSTWAKPYASEWTGEKIASLLREEGLEGKSLDDIDRELFAPAPSPLSGTPAVTVRLSPGAERSTQSSRKVLSLDGTWQMLGVPKGRGDERMLLQGKGWEDAMSAEIP